MATSIKTLKAYTDKEACRHYYPKHEGWQLVENTSDDIKLDMTGQAEILISRDEARDLARLFKHFGEHGTLPIPPKQRPSTVCT